MASWMKVKKKTGGEKGVALLAVIFFLVVIAFMGVIFISLSSTNTTQSINELYSSQALYITEGGLERAGRYLIGRESYPGTCTTSLCACNSITGASFTGITLGPGQFSVTGVYQSTAASPATLFALTNSGDVTIPVNSITGYAPFGRIMVDREAINYTALGMSLAACSNLGPACFLGAVRGADGTLAVQHYSTPTSAKIAQTQCGLTSIGGVPTINSGSNQRSVSQVDVFQDAWAIGYNVGSLGNRPFMTHWDGTSWTNVTASAPNIGGANLVEISMVSSTDGWAVSNQGDFLHWTGTAWVLAAGFTSAATLSSVYMNSSIAGWAVGSNGEIDRWNGTAWAKYNPSPTTRTLQGIYCLSVTYCWAVGTRSGGGAGQSTIIFWNGITWTAPATPLLNGVTLRFVTCVDSTHCWAVGSSGGEIVYWDGTNWTLQDNANPQSLYGIDCTDLIHCWAVGNGGEIMVWNGTAWTLDTQSSVITTQNLTFVSCVTSFDCWATGAGGTLIHWNGSAWTLESPGGWSASQLNSLSLIGPIKPTASWREVPQ